MRPARRRERSRSGASSGAAGEVAGPGRATRPRTTGVAVASFVVGLVCSLTSSAAVEGRDERRALPQQLWGIVVGPDALARMQPGTLSRLRARSLNATVASGLSKRQLARLRRLSASARLTLL